MANKNSEYFSCDKIIYLGLIVILFIWVYQTYYKKNDYFTPPSIINGYNNNNNNNSISTKNKNIENRPTMENDYNNELSNNEITKVFGQSNSNSMGLTSSDLLPNEVTQNNFNSNNQSIGDGILNGLNFLDAGYTVGVNTVGQSLRNANLQLRSEPPNPQVSVSPWMNSTIAPDLQRKSLEGEC